MALEREIIRALSDAHTANCCLDCANKMNHEVIINTHAESGYAMADTGPCSFCNEEYGEVFCDEIIKVQKSSGVSVDEWSDKYPRITGGSMYVREMAGKIKGLEERLSFEIEHSKKLQISVPFWKKLFVSKKPSGK